MPRTINVGTTKTQLSKSYLDEDLISYEKLGVIDNLASAVSKKLNDEYTRNNISSVVAREVGGGAIEFTIIIDHDWEQPKDATAIKSTLGIKG
jgi:hypothetical protein